jgi:hypothetical protein
MGKEKEPEKRGDYRKLCIINHVQHEVYIEVVAVSLLESNYNGDEQAYIMDMYSYPKEYLENGYVSWEWFVGIYDYTEEELGLDMPDIEKMNEL